MDLHFDCVFYYVSDLEASIDFYSGILGVSPTSQDVVARFDLDGVLFELVPSADASVMSGNGNARLCLRVEGIDQAAQDLRARGVQVSNIHIVDNGRLATFKDPDGNELMLWEYS